MAIRQSKIGLGFRIDKGNAKTKKSAPTRVERPFMEIFILGRIKNSAPLNEAEPNEKALDPIEAHQERHTKL